MASLDSRTCQTILDSFYLLCEEAERLYRDRDRNTQAIPEYIELAERVGGMTEMFLECWGICYQSSNRPGYIPPLHQLVILRDRQGLYSEALGILSFLDRMGCRDKKGKGYESRMSKIKEKREKFGDRPPPDWEEGKPLDGSRWRDPTASLGPSEDKKDGDLSTAAIAVMLFLALLVVIWVFTQ